MKITASRYHDFSAGHRVHGHESKCALLHGHNYRIHFNVEAETLDAVGRVVDFSDIKVLCQWLEDNWDHRFLAWRYDTVIGEISANVPINGEAVSFLGASIVWLPFNPTAENMGLYLMGLGQGLLDDIQHRLGGARLKLTSVVVEETRKCSAGVHA